ncbi:COG1216 Predicted glycosyltransferases [Flavobacteriaceae bacterium]
MDISIIIVNYRSWKPLQNCLESLLLIDDSKIAFEVIIIDNFSNDEQFSIFKTRFKDYNFIENNINSGYSNGCNIGSKKAKGDYFLFLNPDTIISETALNTLFYTYKKNPEIGILSCLQVNKKNKFFNQKKVFPTFLQLFTITKYLSKVVFQIKRDSFFSANKELFYPDWTTGALIFMSRNWFEKVGGWNEDYWLYFEDVDLCKKVKEQKGKIAVTNKTSIFHEHGGSSRINFETEYSSRTEVIISKHVYIKNNFSNLSKISAHTFLILFTLLEKIILSLLSLLLFSNIKLKTNRYILKNLCLYYSNAIVEHTWLSQRSVNYQKTKYAK